MFIKYYAYHIISDQNPTIYNDIILHWLMHYTCNNLYILLNYNRLVCLFYFKVNDVNMWIKLLTIHLDPIQTYLKKLFVLVYFSHFVFFGRAQVVIHHRHHSQMQCTTSSQGLSEPFRRFSKAKSRKTGKTTWPHIKYPVVKKHSDLLLKKNTKKISVKCNSNIKSTLCLYYYYYYWFINM